MSTCMRRDGDYHDDVQKPRRITINLGVLAVFFRDVLTIVVLVKLLKYL